MDAEKRGFERAPLLAGTRVHSGKKLWLLVVLAVILVLVVGCLGMQYGMYGLLASYTGSPYANEN